MTSIVSDDIEVSTQHSGNSVESDSIVSALPGNPHSRKTVTQPLQVTLPEMPENQRSASTGSGNGASSGLIRPKRRVINNGIASSVGKTVSRNYKVSSNVIFTNYVELKNDMISPEFSQEIIEQFMVETGIDMANENATKMVEDVIFTFYIENAASQKTGHEKIIDVYGVEVDIMVLLRILVSHGVTPRRFTRGLADRLHAFLRAPENAQLRADLISRYALDDPDHASLAFDGSTHVTNITTEMRQIANMLASRGIYENSASIKNASERTTFDGVLKDSRVHSGTLHNGA